MLSKEQVLSNYKTKEATNGILYISSPGKFEGEPLWVPYFWEIALNGDGCFTERGFLIFICSEDKEEFSELKDREEQYVEVWEDDNGFVRGKLRN